MHPNGSISVIAAATRPARRGVVGTTGSASQVQVRLPANYVADHVDLAYATTTHRAQGMTVDRAHVLAHSGMTRENLYVAMSRGRDANHLYVAVDTLDADCDHLPDPHAALDAHDILRTVLTTTGAEQSATAMITARQDDAASLRRLEPIARTLYADAATGRWVQRLSKLGVDETTVAVVGRDPDAGRLIPALDQVSRINAPDADALLRSLIGEAHQGASLARNLLERAQTYLREHTADDDPPVIHDPAGLDPDGEVLLAQINQLIDDRTAALTAVALKDPPGWLDRIGPEPTTPAAHAAWLAEITTTVAHHDRLPAAATRPATLPDHVIARQETPP